tara:strand:- start:165 stop:686 length:522 start_codon:yes stop_codon:yes gene_type:complete
MKKIFKYILFLSLPIFIISVFFLALENDNQYTTENLVGQKIKNFELPTLNNDSLINEESLAQNNYTLINFWASWCAPCRMENKFLLSIKQKYDLKILGINFKDKKSYAKDFLKEFGNPYYKIASDQDGRTSVIFGIFGIPESILIDQNLFVIKKFVGPLNEQDLTEIENIIKK